MFSVMSVACHPRVLLKPFFYGVFMFWFLMFGSGLVLSEYTRRVAL